MSALLMRSRRICNSLQAQTILSLERVNAYHSGAVTKCFVNGVNIAYEKIGTGPMPILLLPGATCTGRSAFDPQLQGLSQDKFTMIALDNRGYGRSIPPERDYPIDFFHRDARDAAKVMANLGYSSYSVLGWSDGANVACIVAGQNPDKVEKLVIWGGYAFITKEDLALHESLKDVSNWSPRITQPLIEIHGEEYLQRTWNAWVDALKIIYEKREGGNICMDEVKNISAPCLIIHSVKDWMVPMIHPEFFHENIKNSILDYWYEGKHNLHMTSVKRFNAELEQFLVYGTISG